MHRGGLRVAFAAAFGAMGQAKGLSRRSRHRRNPSAAGEIRAT